MERSAIFPGSFDPFTRGHAALVDEALNLFDRVIIGIGNNTSKQGLLTVVNRKRLIDDLYAGNARVEARIYTGLTGEFAEEMGACAIIRGVRNTTAAILPCSPSKSVMSPFRLIISYTFS